MEGAREMFGLHGDLRLGMVVGLAALVLLALSVAMALLCSGTGGVIIPAFGFLWALPLVVGLLFINQPACPVVTSGSSPTSSPAPSLSWSRGSGSA